MCEGVGVYVHMCVRGVCTRVVCMCVRGSEYMCAMGKCVSVGMGVSVPGPGLPGEEWEGLQWRGGRRVSGWRVSRWPVLSPLHHHVFFTLQLLCAKHV